jgi:uncharacterized protein DUF3551
MVRRSILGVLAGATLIAAAVPAHAQYYPWCLVISDKTGAWSCYFATREQCMASAGGNAGFCTRNPAAPDPPPPPRRLRQ